MIGKSPAVLALIAIVSAVAVVSAFIAFTVTVDLTAQEPLDLQNVSGTIGDSPLSCTTEGSTVTCTATDVFAGEFGSIVDRKSVV